MEKYQQIKRNHHYVWNYYLKNWSKDKKNIFYISKKGRISQDSTKALSKAIDFYKINSFKHEDIQFIESISLAHSSDEVRKIHYKQLNYFRMLLSVENIYVPDIYNKEHQDIISQVKGNSLENTYAIIEKLALVVLSELASGNKNVLERKDNMIAFLCYLGHQITRTKAFKNKVLNALKKENNYFLWERNWWYISYMLGINLGHSFLQTKKEDNHIFIVNNTDVSFLTSDNPTINIHSSLEVLDRGKAPEFMDLYFPISPKYAYMINNSNEYNYLQKNITKEDVLKLNDKVYAKKDETVFADSEELIKITKEYSKPIRPSKFQKK